MARELSDLLQDIIDAASDAVSYASSLDLKTFERMPDEDRMRYRALKNALTELGEALKGLPQDIAQRHSDVDWRGTVGLRDIVAHQYFRLDMRRLWPVLTKELPHLISVIQVEKDALEPPGTGL
jgi:uncharacterized protein with HEPN domain